MHETFKVSNFKTPKEKLVELSGEEVEKKNNKKKSEKKRERITKKVKKSQSKGKKSERKRKRTQEPGPQARKVENVNLQEVVDSLRKQAVLAGRVFDMGIITLPAWTLCMTWWRSSLGCTCSTKNPPSSMKKRFLNSITMFNFWKMGVSSHV